jgi:colanic acid biosynthesis glycosyl transferase WcaI
VAGFFEKMILKAFDVVVTISGRMQERLCEKGIAQERLTVIRNWVDLGKFKAATTNTEYRREFGVSDQDFVVLYSGNLGIKQGLNVLLDAARLLVSVLGLQFVIAGDGPEKDRLTAQYGALPNVRFIPLQPESRLSEFLSFPDLHVLPQERGAADLVLPSKLGGMLASQKPCIVMADPDTELHDFLGDCVTLIPPGDALSLADTIRSVMASQASTLFPDRHSRLQLLDARRNLSAFEAILRTRKVIKANQSMKVAGLNT